MIESTSKYMHQGDFLGSDGENFLVALSEQEIYSLDAATYYVWSLCDGENSVEDIINNISVNFNLDKKEIEESIKNIIKALLDAKLLKEL
ncbi:MAG: PqqD family protein [Sulfolobales archaeon]